MSKLITDLTNLDNEVTRIRSIFEPHVKTLLAECTDGKELNTEELNKAALGRKIEDKLQDLQVLLNEIRDLADPKPEAPEEDLVALGYM